MNRVTLRRRARVRTVAHERWTNGPAFLLTFLLTFPLTLLATLTAVPCIASVGHAQAALRVGDYDTAISLLRHQLETGTTGNDTLLPELFLLVDAYRDVGMNVAALSALNAWLPTEQVNIEAMGRVHRGAILRELGRISESAEELELTADLSNALTPLYRARLALERGNTAIELGDSASAAKHYGQAANLAGKSRFAHLNATARLNGLRLQIDAKDLTELRGRLATTANHIARIEPKSDAAMLHVSLGELYLRSMQELGYGQEFLQPAFTAFTDARGQAADPRTRAFALGFLGTLYEREGRLAEALRLGRQAALIAQERSTPEQYYRWEWLIARVLRRLGQNTAAQSSYARAVETLAVVRLNYVAGSRQTFKRSVEPVYTQYADIMLEHASRLPAGSEKQRTLTTVRDLLETLKEAEVQDYFANECVAAEVDSNASQQLADGVAVVYPVFLKSRTEVLIETKTGLIQITTPIGRNQMTQKIRQLRINLERTKAGERYLEPAQRLYDWLLRPAETHLKAQNVNTLVVVPEGALRTIPIAALHDGDSFLLQHYAVATTPAIKLTRQASQGVLDRMLVGGLSESVQGFAELPSVDQEIATVSSIFPGQALQNATFGLAEVTDQLNRADFSAAHFATHGEFSGDYRKSFLLTYDDRLTLTGLQNALQERDDNQLDLLVLSACKTAAGDDRAALGLAGVAVQSGARSALASLWYISDRATAMLVSAFYQHLQESGRKASSLRKAQLDLIASPDFSHPSYWAPYLLVGDWL